MRNTLIGIGCVLTMAGCTVRSDNIYQEEVTKVIMTKSDQLASCHGEALEADPAAAGTVTVDFRVDVDTGNFSGPAVDAATTTAPESLQQCVLAALAGLVLSPADTQRPAAARYEFVFNPVSGAAPTAEAPADTGGKSVTLKSAPGLEPQ